MACATTGTTCALHISTSLTITQQPFPPRPKPHHFTFPPLILLPKTSISSSHHYYKQYPNLLKFTSKSIDVSKEDKPVSEQPPTTTTNSATPTFESDEFSLPPPPAAAEPQNLMDKRLLEEKFAVLNTGIYECRSCGYRYDEAAGDPSYPIPPGLQFGKLPEDWRCPTCGAAKTFFESKSVEIAGFAENQQFGLGGNALTASQKAVLIYGGLFLGFLLFLSGYFLQ